MGLRGHKAWNEKRDREIRARYRDGMSYREIAQMFRLAYSTVYRICNEGAK